MVTDLPEGLTSSSEMANTVCEHRIWRSDKAEVDRPTPASIVAIQSLGNNGYVSALDHVGFSHEYRIELDPEFPGNGVWACPTIGFTASGIRTDFLDSPWGTPVVVALSITEAWD
jgi:hypothetical protein